MSVFRIVAMATGKFPGKFLIAVASTLLNWSHSEIGHPNLGKKNQILQCRVNWKYFVGSEYYYNIPLINDFQVRRIFVYLRGPTLRIAKGTSAELQCKVSTIIRLQSCARFISDLTNFRSVPVMMSSSASGVKLYFTFLTVRPSICTA